MHTHPHDVIIIGAGAAGLAAAQMLGRARRKVLVLDSGEPRNAPAAHMHGIVGFDGLPPQDFHARGRAEAEAYGIGFRHATVTSVTYGGPGLVLDTSAGSFETRALLLASGLHDRLAPVPGLQERWGGTILHCPYCHGHEFAGQRLGVLAVAPHSLHQAELLRQWSPDLTVFTAGLDEISGETARRLRSRGLKLEPTAVAEVRDEATVVLDDGRTVALDAIFTFGVPAPRDEMLAPLRLEREETMYGSFIRVDPMGRTSGERIWAAGNVVNPAANVPVALGAGSMAGAALNAALVGWEFDEADRSPVEFWEERYSGTDRVWSGKVNTVLAEIAADLTPGRALDLGCGEGADVIWLARQGWRALGVDISATAVDRARAHGVPGTEFTVSDLDPFPEGEFDLISASFLHSPVALDRLRILREAAAHLAPGGHLLITTHAAPPPWAEGLKQHSHTLLSPAEDLELLDLGAEFPVLLAEVRVRAATAPDGSPAELEDGVILIRRD